MVCSELMWYCRAGLGNRLGTLENFLWSEPLLFPCVTQVSKAHGKATARLILHVPAPWLGWVEGPGRIWSSQLPWRYASGFIGWSLLSELFHKRKSGCYSLERNGYWRCVYGYTHTHTRIHSIRLTVSLLGLHETRLWHNCFFLLMFLTSKVDIEIISFMYLLGNVNFIV